MVLTDYKMRSLDGIEVIRRLRPHFRLRGTFRSCGITVVNDREGSLATVLWQAGATDFLIRPIDRLECGARWPCR